MPSKSPSARTEAEEGRGRLVLVGTPIGNREDLSPRAHRALLEADLLLCEDTRSPLRLLAEGEHLAPRLSCFVGNEHERIPVMLDHLASGRTVAFVSEAGLPVWSDPGRLLVCAAVEEGYEVDVIPGPTAAAMALALSGFPAEGALFVGFVARKGPERKVALAEVASNRGAVVFHEAGNRVASLLASLVEVVGGERRAVVARELTKRHQEVLRGPLSELATSLAGEGVRGEVTVVLEGRGEVSPDGDAAIETARAVLELCLEATEKPRERARRLAELTGLPAQDLYRRLTKRSEGS